MAHEIELDITKPSHNQMRNTLSLQGPLLGYIVPLFVSGVGADDGVAILNYLRQAVCEKTCKFRRVSYMCPEI